MKTSKVYKLFFLGLFAIGITLTISSCGGGGSSSGSDSTTDTTEDTGNSTAMGDGSDGGGNGGGDGGGAGGNNGGVGGACAAGDRIAINIPDACGEDNNGGETLTETFGDGVCMHEPRINFNENPELCADALLDCDIEELQARDNGSDSECR